MFGWFRKENKKSAVAKIEQEPVSCPVLSIWDQCAKAFTFPMLDNGYVYLADSRLSLFKEGENWAIVFEIFGHMPRAGAPDLNVTTISNVLVNRKTRDDFVNEEAFNHYLNSNPYNQSNNFAPLKREEWPDCYYLEPSNNDKISLREQAVTTPNENALLEAGIKPEEKKLQIFEFCRYLAYTNRSDVLATSKEKRFNLPDKMNELLVLDDWNHPDLAAGEKPSQSETFQLIRDVLISGDIQNYRPTLPGNTHWKNWPDSGTL